MKLECILLFTINIHLTIIASQIQDVIETPGYWPRKPDTGSCNLMPVFGDTPLHLGASLGDSVLVQKMIDGGMAINNINGQGYTPLDCALVNRNDQEAILLLKHGAYSNIHQHGAPYIIPIPFKNKVITSVKKGGSVVIITFIVWLAWYLLRDEEPIEKETEKP
jgi:hypothetical protein